jgi:hypothetical protein
MNLFDWSCATFGGLESNPGADTRANGVITGPTSTVARSGVEIRPA